jgi:hypothetical protein
MVRSEMLLHLAWHRGTLAQIADDDAARELKVTMSSFIASKEDISPFRFRLGCSLLLL